MDNRTYSDGFSSRSVAALLAACCFVLISVSQVSAAEDATAAQAFRKQLHNVLTGHGDPKARMSVRVVDLSTGQSIYDHDSDTCLIPASNMKLMVIAAAIDRFGTDHQFQTILAIRGRDLVVVGGGDPTFGDEKLCAARGEAITAVFHEWAGKLKAAGIQQVSGNLVIDDSCFDRQFIHPNWPPDQFQAWYEAPIGGLNFNANCFDVSVKPGKPGQQAAVSLVPGNVLLKIVNQTRSGEKHQPAARRKAGTDEVIVSGSVTRSDRLGPITVRDPGLYFGYVLRTVLAAKGIRVQGNVVREKVDLGPDRIPVGGHGVAIHRAPMLDAAQRAGRQSLGMMAEGLIKLLAKEETGVGSWDGGRMAMEKFFLKSGVSPGQFTVDDGSGLSRRNLLSATATTQVLAAMYKAPGDRFQALRDCLARPARDGTLKRRMTGPDTKDRIFAKTGYINGVRTLAGYVQTKSGRWLAFAIYYNGTGKTRPLAQLQDKACEIMVRWPDLSTTGQTAGAASDGASR